MMKLKLILVPLAVFGLVGVSYANCSKDEIIKLIDKGYFKTEINRICGKSKSKSKSKQETSKWINPTQKVCNANGGKISYGDCKADWSNAKAICQASGGRLATLDEFKKVITDCNGTLGDFYSNLKNSAYHNCLDKKDFSSKYWSSTDNGPKNNPAWGAWVFGGNEMTGYGKSQEFYVRCMREEQ